MKALMGMYEYVDELLEAAKRLKDSGYTISVFSPIPIGHELDPVLGERHNWIKYFTFLGGICGLVFGLVVTLGTAALYILPRGGKPVWPITPTLLITYETTILVGVMFTLMGFLMVARLPWYGRRIYDPEVAVDSFGLLVDDIREDKFAEVESILREFGAGEVKTIEKP